MDLQKRLAAEILKCSPKRITYKSDDLPRIREAITKFDVRNLIKQGLIKKEQVKGVSRARAKKAQIQRRKGRKTGHGSRKAKATARLKPKDAWIARARAQRGLLKRMRNSGLLSTTNFRALYLKIKGGFFRSRNHIKLYVKEQDMITEKKHGK